VVDVSVIPDSLRSMKLSYTVQLWQEGDHYVAHAMPLDVASSGPSPAKARKALKEAVTLFLETAKEAGTLEQVLEETGYTRGARGWSSPKWLKTEKAAALLSA
jgi:predicted RNase H-like HicB family nuclease